jgi:hypothetical protein
MRVGIFHYLSTGYSIDPAVLAQRAEALGFDSLWLPEHPIFPVTTASPFPLGGPIPEFYSALIDPFGGHARACTLGARQNREGCRDTAAAQTPVEALQAAHHVEGALHSAGAM